MIKNITLKFGRGPSLPAEPIQTTPITVFVGPNHSGKSKVLQEIYSYCKTGQKNVSDVILGDLEFEAFGEEKAAEMIAQVTLTPNHNEHVQPGNIIVGRQGTRLHIAKQTLVDALRDTKRHVQNFCGGYLKYNTLILDGRSRIGLVNEQDAGDLLGPSENSFQVLFKDKPKREEVRRIIHIAFGLYFVIDPTKLGKLRIRLASRAPTSELEECGIHTEALQYHNAALPIEQTSDGVKAFTGMITQIIAGDPLILLIDEPEAFLHPALSFTLGQEIAHATQQSEKRLFVSTHSASFVMGCIQSGVPINIVRLTYQNNVATARILANADILRLMRHPLLRSTGVLNGLFYDFVVVTESDTDRAFYQEINERLLRFKQELGIPNCLFLNAHNKQTVRTIMQPLREMGIPAACIVDIDIVKDGGSEWTKFLASGGIPQMEHQSLGDHRAAIKQKFEATGKNMKRDGGVTLLSKPDRESADNLFDRLGSYGLFVVRGGEVESWLRHLGVSGHGPEWLIDIFEKIGEDQTSPDYVRPGNGDVWKFMGLIKGWLTDPNRKGIPS